MFQLDKAYLRLDLTVNKKPRTTKHIRKRKDKYLNRSVKYLKDTVTQPGAAAIKAEKLNETFSIVTLRSVCLCKAQLKQKWVSG